MTLDEFTRLADTWGGDIARWPDRFRDAAEHFARTHPDAASILDARRSSTSGGGQRAGRLGGTRRHGDACGGVAACRRRAGPASRPILLRWLAPAMSFACAAGLGIYLGFAYPVLSGPGNSIAGKALVMILEEDTMLPWIQ